MRRKIRLGVIFGGKSAEHDISILSAKSIMRAINKEKYHIVPIRISKTGKWSRAEKRIDFMAGQKPGRLLLDDLDVIFPVLHGPLGEDGTIQGLFKLTNLPFVGADVLGSAVAMDKDVAKRLLQASGLPTARYRAFRRPDMIDFAAITKELGVPLFVKPANLGSSVGVSKVKNEAELAAAVALAFRHDQKILIEETVVGRELECAVLGNETLIASLPGEIIVKTAPFYNYEAKYINENSAALGIPAELPNALTKKVQQLAIKAVQALCIEGMARVDFFLRGENDVIVNEVNTIPGFTKISMYPKLWAASGLPYPRLIDRLIELALARFTRDQKLEDGLLSKLPFKDI